jgi:hypothetical protein
MFLLSLNINNAYDKLIDYYYSKLILLGENYKNEKKPFYIVIY